MVALKTERQAFIWRVSPQAIPKDANVTVTMKEITDVIEAAWKKKEARIYIGDGKVVPHAEATKQGIKNCIYIADIRKAPDGSTLTYLINRGDPDAADPAFLGVTTESVRTVPPQNPDEIQGWSAHLVIRLAGKPPHRACFERMQNVPSSLVERLFQDILDRHTKNNPAYIYEKIVTEKKKPKKILRDYRIKLAVERVPSEQIIKDLEDGELSEIVLIHEDSSYQGPGSPSIIKSATSVLKLKTKQVDKTLLEKLVPDIAKWAQDKNYTDIQFILRNLPGGGTSSPRFKLEQTDALETLYARSQLLKDFGTLLQRCYAKVSSDIEKKLLALLVDDSKWQ